MKITCPARSRTSPLKSVPRPEGIEVVSGRRALGSFFVDRHSRQESEILSTTVGRAVTKKYLDKNLINWLFFGC